MYIKKHRWPALILAALLILSAGTAVFAGDPETANEEKQQIVLDKIAEMEKAYPLLTADNILDANEDYSDLKSKYNGLGTLQKKKIQSEYDAYLAKYEKMAGALFALSESDDIADYWYVVVVNQVNNEDNTFGDVLGRYAVRIPRTGASLTIRKNTALDGLPEEIAAVAEVDEYFYYSSSLTTRTLTGSGSGGSFLTAAELVLPQRPMSGDGWKIDRDSKTLTVTGNIEYPSNNLYPWYVMRNTEFDKVVIRGTPDQPLDYVGKDAFSSYRTIQSVVVENVKEVRNAFNFCTGIRELTLKNVGALGDTTEMMSRSAVGAFASNTALEKINMENVRYIGNGAFYSCIRLSELSGGLDGVKWIGSAAFANCRSLKSVTIPGDCEYVAGEAFYHCTALEEFKVLGKSTRLGYSDAFGTAENLRETDRDALYDRMVSIMDGKGNLKLRSVEEATSLTLAKEWTDDHSGDRDGNYGSENVTDMTVEGTQVTKAARWTDRQNKEAAVQFCFESDFEQGKDFLFVMDYSDSMANINQYTDSKFFNLQSKVIDAADVLLGTEGYDNRVGFVTFDKSVLKTEDFTSDKDAVIKAVRESAIQGDATNYADAFAKARDMIGDRSDKSRETVLIFISDGLPNQPKGNVDAYKDTVQALKDAGTEIYTVFMYDDTPIADASEPSLEDAEPIMRGISTNGICYSVQDTGEFSAAIEKAIREAYRDYTITDMVGRDFDLVEGSFEVTVNGQPVSRDCVTFDPATETLVWSLNGVLPREVWTLTFHERLEEGAPESGVYDTNNGDASVAERGIAVNAVETPRLSIDPDVSQADPEKPTPEPEKPAPEPEKPAPEPEKPAPEPEKPAPEPEDPTPEPGNPAPEPGNPAPTNPQQTVIPDDADLAYAPEEEGGTGTGTVTETIAGAVEEQDDEDLASQEPDTVRKTKETEEATEKKETGKSEAPKTGDSFAALGGVFTIILALSAAAVILVVRKRRI